MAPGVVSPPLLTTTQFPTSPILHSGRFNTNDEETFFVAARQTSRYGSRKMSMVDTSNISNVVYSLKRRSSEELGSATSAKLLNATHDSLMDWISAQRMSHLPPEGSSHDKVLAWAQLFVERLHSFDMAIEDFAGDSYLATQLAYGYCAILLQLGKENAPALMISFGFFYNMSVSLVNLLERTELFSVSQEIREHLILALSDLVTLVASVATHFHKAICGLTTASLSVNIYNTFPGQIKSFVDRCEMTAESMWRHQLMKEGMDVNKVSSVKKIKNWIAPEDHVLSNVANTMSHLAHDREELTCLWVGPYLTRFLKGENNTLSISGKPGSGKTVLSSVIVDYLQHPIGGVAYNTLFIPINSRIPAETSPRAIVKTILSQLFDKRIGNVQLLQILSDAYERCEKTSCETNYDNTIWVALERALTATLPGSKELVIVVDGIDEASCRESVLLQKLTDVVISGNNVKLITLGAEKPSALDSQECVQVTEDLVFDDIMAVVRSHFDNIRSFSSLPELEQETLVTRITKSSKGSFLWAKLATKRVRSESSSDTLRKAVDSIVDTHTTVTDFVLHTLHSPGVGDNAKRMLLWLATAERPLSLKELAGLLSVDMDKSAVIDHHLDILSNLRPVNSLVFLQDGLAYIRHGLTRAAILDIFSKGKLVPSIKDHQADLVGRLLLYMKTCVTQQHEPSLSFLGVHETAQLIAKHPLLDFAARYWPVHFRRTFVFTKEGEVAAIKSLSKHFPTSNTAILLQGALWQNIPPPQLMSYQKMVTDICRHLLTNKSTVTLQSVILLAIIYRQVGFTTECISMFHDATAMANSLLTPRHPVTMQTASAFLEITSSMVTNTKSEIMTQREDALLILIECYKIQYGQTSEMVISSMNRLVEHYQWTREEQKSQQLISAISSISNSSSATIQREGDLHVHLHSRHEKEKTGKGVGLLLDVEEHDELIERSDARDFEYSLKKTEKQVREGRTDVAEHAYIEIWQRASREYSSHRSEMWETRKMQAVLDYAKFLNTHNREVESASVISSVWEEYKQSSMAVSENSVSLFYEMAKVMIAVGLTSEALSVLKNCAQYYQNTNRTQSPTYHEIQQRIQALSKELMRSADSSTSEALLEEMVLEASKSSSTMDQAAFTALSRLVQIYISQHRWQDATQLIKKVFRGVWPSLYSPNVQDVAAPSKHKESCIELSGRLAECYHARRRFQKEDDLRLRVYRAMRMSCGVDNKLRERVTSDLVSFYNRSSQVDRVISIRQEVLEDYTNEYGPEHPAVIKMLWSLAELTRPQPIFVEYYQRIITALNKDSHICKPETLEAYLIVATELWNKGQFAEALPYYDTLFTTFLRQPKTNAKFNDQIFDQELYNRYTVCLRNTQSDYEVLHKIAVEYRSQCKAIFGTNASITIQANLILARVCQESKRYEMDAITIYEELLRTNSTEIDRNEISAILDSIYEEQATMVTTTRSESVSAIQSERAAQVLQNRITSARETHGWAHEESLFKLTELVQFYNRQKQSEKVQSELKETAIKVLTSERSSVKLMAAASTIASSYVATNQIHRATELKEELYRQIVLKDTSEAKYKFDLTFRGRESLVFLAQFEHGLSRKSAAVNDILAELTTQYVYVQEFRSLIKHRNTSLHRMTVSTARLYQCLADNGRQTAATQIFEDYKQFLVNNEAQQVKMTKPSQVDIFLHTLLKHFSAHRSNNFIRSVGICTNEHVVQLLKAHQYDKAVDLALASFTYISAHDEYETPAIAKFVLILGMTIAGRHLKPKPNETARKRMADASGLITQSVLRVLSDLNIDLEQISLGHLNNLIGLLGDQKDYQTLSWFLGILWNSREAQRNWRPSVTLALGRRFIMARYLVGESMAALRLAEDIVYNCRRVYGIRHVNTLEMSIFLTQLYTGMAQRYQNQKAGREIANRYYKKSATIHENILRVFSDPSYAEMEAGFGNVNGNTGYGYMWSPDNAAYLDGGMPKSPTSVGDVSDAEHVRQHLHYFKLALERLGGWPKDYGEYQRLNGDVFREFGAELRDVEGMDKWNLGGYGSGKAESNEDFLDLAVADWELGDAQLGY